MLITLLYLPLHLITRWTQLPSIYLFMFFQLGVLFFVTIYATRTRQIAIESEQILIANKSEQEQKFNAFKQLLAGILLANFSQLKFGALSVSERRSIIGLLIERSKYLEASTLLENRAFSDGLEMSMVTKAASGLYSMGYLTRAISLLRHNSIVDEPTEANLLMSACLNQLKFLNREIEVNLVKVKTLARTAKRIVHVVTATMPGGIQSGYTIRTQSIAREQVKLGFDVHVIGQPGLGKSSAERMTVVDGVRYHFLQESEEHLRFSEEWFKAYVLALQEVIVYLSPGVIHAHSDYINAWAASEVSESTGIPWVYEVRGFWHETLIANLSEKFEWSDLEELKSSFGLPDTFWMRERQEDYWRGKADAVVTLTETMAQEIILRGCSPDLIHIVPNGVDSKSFIPQEKNNELIKSIGISKNAKVVGYISSFSAYEGIDDLISAFSILQTRNPSEELALLLVGDGSESKRLSDLALSTGLRNIFFTGRVPNASINEYYNLIDIFVVPRKPHRVCHLVSPLKPFEAMAKQKTLLMANVVALSEIAEQSGGVKLFESGSPDSLAKELENLMIEPELGAKLALTARHWVAEYRSWERCCAAYVQAYESINLGTDR